MKLKEIIFILFLLMLTGQSVAVSCFSKPGTNTDKAALLKLELENKRRQTAHEQKQARNRNACLINYQQFKKLPVSKVLVDVRTKGKARTIPLNNPNIINIPLHSIKQKTFLKTRPVVLVPIGAELRDLLLNCGELRTKGFKQVYVLQDGVTALQKESKNRKIQDVFDDTDSDDDTFS